jgi:large subunit ribosomal protein L10
MAHVAEWKKEEVNDLKELINTYDVIGIANLTDIPARQLQEMRKTLKGDATIRMSKKTLISLALKDSNKDENILALADHMEGQPALIFTEMNPFKLYKILESSKTQAPAKAGATAPEDIVVPKGDTGFAPGPILGELQQVGIPAKIEKGSIVVQKDEVVVKAGEKVSAKLAGILTRLDIKPMEVGIDLTAAFEDETVYTADLLTIDEEQTLADVQKAFTQALNLSINAAVYNKVSAPAIIQKAATDALNLAVNAAVVNSKTADVLLSRAYSQMLALASEASEKDASSVDDELLSKLSASAAASAPVEEAPAEEPEEEEEEEEDAEEDAAVGLGALFG